MKAFISYKTACTDVGICELALCHLTSDVKELHFNASNYTQVKSRPRMEEDSGEVVTEQILNFNVVLV